MDSILTREVDNVSVILFLICFAASAVGAIAGFGGGVIIKPVLDAAGLLPVSTVSFLSGCTALGMALSSTIQTRKSDVKLELRTSTPLAAGAAAGGIIGKFLFELIKNNFQSENILGGIQAVCLTVITAGVFSYVCVKGRLKSFQVENISACLLIGIVLGVISSFLGIGGGTSNVAVLFLFFSMDAKKAAKNSLYIIIFSQSASIIQAILTNTVPPFQPEELLLMVGGGIVGAFAGAFVSKKISVKAVEKLLKLLLIIIICIDVSNAVRFFI